MLNMLSKFIIIKLVILFAFLAVNVQSLALPLNLSDKCLSENNVTGPEFKSKTDQALSENNVENIEMNYMCYVHCLAVELNVLDANGRLDIEAMEDVEKLTDKNVEVIKECNSANESMENICIYSFEMLLCFIKNIDHTQYLNISPGRPDN